MATIEQADELLIQATALKTLQSEIVALGSQMRASQAAFDDLQTQYAEKQRAYRLVQQQVVTLLTDPNLSVTA